VSLVSKDLLVAPHNDTGDTYPPYGSRHSCVSSSTPGWTLVQLDLEGGEIELCDARGGFLGRGALQGPAGRGGPGAYRWVSLW